MSETKSFLKIGHRFRDFELSRLKGAKLSVLLSLALHMNEYGHTWPSNERIAHETGYSVRQVQRITKKFKDKGFLTPQENPGIRSNTYMVSYPNVGHHMLASSSVVDGLGFVTENVKDVTHKTTEDDTHVIHEGVTHVTPPTHEGVTPMSPKVDSKVDTTKEDSVVVAHDVKPKDISQELWNYSLTKCKGPNVIAYARGVLKKNPFWKPEKKTVDPDSEEARQRYLSWDDD